MQGRENWTTTIVMLAWLVTAGSVMAGTVTARATDETGSGVPSERGPGGSFTEGCGAGVSEAFPEPADLRGLTFRDGNLWGLSTAGVLYEMDPDDGMTLSTITVTGAGNFYGLGWDSQRDVFVMSDAVDDAVHQVDLTGMVVGTRPLSVAGPVGAAHDPMRDGYWISDFDSDTLILVDPDDGSVQATLGPWPGAVRISGVGFDPDRDLLMFHARQAREVFLVRASDGGLVEVVTIPGTGNPEGHGAAIRPSDHVGYMTRFQSAQVHRVDFGPVSCLFADGFESGNANGWAFVGW